MTFGLVNEEAGERGPGPGREVNPARGRPLHLWIVVGTRPEVIKLWPVIVAAREEPRRFRVSVISTGQHRELLSSALKWTGLVPDLDLGVMEEGQAPAVVAARVLEGLDAALRGGRPDVMLVQGDTTTAWAAATAGFYRRVPVAHVEAGLRSGHRDAPFPEEAHRRMIGVVADLHLAPTWRAYLSLRREGIPASRILVTGNTAVDALNLVRRCSGGRFRDPRLAAYFPPDRRVVLLTTHRRESWGEPLVQAYAGILDALEAVPDVHVVFPVHLNPAVQGPARASFEGHPRVHLIEPPPYPDFVEMLARCFVVLTDSGGIQEEAPSLGKPVLVLREKTERREGLEAGVARLVGLARERVADELRAILTNEGMYRAMIRDENPYGDGRAAGRILEMIEFFMGRRAERPQPFCPQGRARA